MRRKHHLRLTLIRVSQEKKVAASAAETHRPYVGEKAPSPFLPKKNFYQHPDLLPEPRTYTKVKKYPKRNGKHLLDSFVMAKWPQIGHVYRE